MGINENKDRDNHMNNKKRNEKLNRKMREKLTEVYSDNYEAQKINSFPESAIDKELEEIKDEVKSPNNESIKDNIDESLFINILNKNKKIVNRIDIRSVKLCSECWHLSLNSFLIVKIQDNKILDKHQSAKYWIRCRHREIQSATIDIVNGSSNIIEPKSSIVELEIEQLSPESATFDIVKGIYSLNDK